MTDAVFDQTTSTISTTPAHGRMPLPSNAAFLVPLWNSARWFRRKEKRFPNGGVDARRDVQEDPMSEVMEIMEHNFVRPRLWGRTDPAAPGRYADDAESPSPPRTRDLHERQDVKTRVLVVFEDDFRSYREAIALAIQTLRPDAEVTVAEPNRFEAEATRIAPHLLVCDRLDAGDSDATLAWIQLSHESKRPATVCLDGRLSEAANPTVDDLLSLFDEVETLARSRLTR